MDIIIVLINFFLLIAFITGVTVIVVLMIRILIKKNKLLTTQLKEKSRESREIENKE